MKKFKRISIVVAVLALTVLLAAGCQSFKWGPVGTTDGDADVVGNGSLAVRQGGYVYYVNGKDATANIVKPSDNYFGKASVKGSIIKSKIGEDGRPESGEIVVPKMFYTEYAKGGIYVYGDWIYYVSPSTKTDNDSKVVVTTLEYMRTKTDGTKTQSIISVDGSATEYIFTPTGLIYYSANTVKRVAYTDTKVGKETTLAENVASVLWPSDVSTYKKGDAADYMFYTKAAEDTSISSTLVFATNGEGEAKKVFDEKSFAAGDEIALGEQNTISLRNCVAAADGSITLYYTRKSAAAGSQPTLYSHKFADVKFQFDAAAEVAYNNADVSKFFVLADGSVMDASAAEVKIYSPMDDDFVNKRTFTLSAAPTVLFFDGDYMYYLISNKLKRIGYAAETPVEEAVSEETMASDWLKPSKVGDLIFYIDSDESSYAYVLNYKDYALSDNSLKQAEGKYAAGYEENKKTEDGLIPALMTKADKETYIKAHPVKKD